MRLLFVLSATSESVECMVKALWTFRRTQASLSIKEGKSALQVKCSLNGHVTFFLASHTNRDPPLQCQWLFCNWNISFNLCTSTLLFLICLLIFKSNFLREQLINCLLTICMFPQVSAKKEAFSCLGALLPLEKTQKISVRQSRFSFPTKLFTQV